VSRRRQDPHQPDADEEHDGEEPDHDCNHPWVIMSESVTSVRDWSVARSRDHRELPRLSEDETQRSRLSSCVAALVLHLRCGLGGVPCACQRAKPWESRE
jgi:hypothetical protein